MIVSKQSQQLRSDLNIICSYAKQNNSLFITAAVDTLKSNILRRVEQLENTLALNRITDERLIEDIKDKANQLVIDTYDEGGNQD